MSGGQGGSHIEVGILDNDACALRMISIVLRQRDAAIHIAWNDTNAQYTLERMVFDSTSNSMMTDVIVLDLALNGISGIDVCRQIRLRNAKVGILGVSSYALNQYRSQLALAGAQGLFSKQEILSPNFVEAVRTAASGESVDVAGGFLSAKDAYARLHAVASVPYAEISTRELEILRMYARGLTTKEIGGQLSISSATVLSHVNHAAQKLGVKKRVERLEDTSRPKDRVGDVADIAGGRRSALEVTGSDVLEELREIVQTQQSRLELRGFDGIAFFLVEPGSQDSSWKERTLTYWAALVFCVHW